VSNLQIVYCQVFNV